MTLKKKIKTQIYTSSSSENDDENEISHSSGKKDNCIWENFSPDNIHEGIYLLVEFTGGCRKKTIYRYAAIAQGDVEDDGEIKIMCLNAIDETKKIFQVNEADVSYIQYEQIKCLLPSAKLKLKGNQIYYEFPISLDIFERM